MKQQQYQLQQQIYFLLRLVGQATTRRAVTTQNNLCIMFTTSQLLISSAQPDISIDSLSAGLSITTTPPASLCAIGLLPAFTPAQPLALLNTTAHYCTINNTVDISHRWPPRCTRSNHHTGVRFHHNTLSSVCGTIHHRSKLAPLPHRSNKRSNLAANAYI